MVNRVRQMNGSVQEAKELHGQWKLCVYNLFAWVWCSCNFFFFCFFPCVCEQARNMNPIHVDDHFFPPFFVFCICMQIRWNDAMHQPNSPGKIRQTHSFRALNVAVVVVGLLISLLIFHYKDYNHAYKICDAVRLLIGWL